MKNLTPKRLSKALSMVLSLTLLAGCGGGSNSNSSTVVTPPDDPTPTPTTLTITAVDGYLENARVFIDLNQNYQFDDGEPNAMTNAQGQVQFDITTIADALTKPVIVEAIAGQTIDHGINTTIRHHYSMIAPPGSEVVSPLTTLAQYTLVNQQQVDLTSAIASLETQLGLPAGSNIMADYLASASHNEQLHAIARAIVPLLPQDLSSLFGNSESVILTDAATIADAINNAVAAGANPLNLFTHLNSEGYAQTTEIDMNHAEDFLSDVQLWSDEISGGFLQAAHEFTSKISIAGQLIEADTTELLNLTLDFSKAGFLALGVNNYGPIDASDIVDGATGTVTVTRGNLGLTSTIEIDATVDDKVIDAIITVPSSDAFATTMTAELSSDDVTITVNEGSSLTVHSDTLMPSSLALNTTVATKQAQPSDDIVTFNGTMLLDTSLFENSAGVQFVLPTIIELQGDFNLNNNESFYAELMLSSEITVVDHVVEVNNLSARIALDAEFAEVANAKLIFDLNQVDIGSELTLTIAYGDKFITIDIYLNNDEQKVVLNNSRGITLTFDFALEANKSDLGHLTLGANTVATVSKASGKYQLTFTDGQIVQLF